MTEQTDTSLRDAAQRLSTARIAKAAIDARVAEANAAFEATHAELMAQYRQAAAETAEADSILRRLALAVHETTGEKSLGYGISVATTEKVTYDPADAVDWAKRSGSLPVTETIDMKAFDKVARAIDLPFVQRTVVPSIRIASDLEAALTAEAAAVPGAAS